MTNRFSKIDEQGHTLADDATAWVAVYDSTTGLMWSASDAAESELNHDAATVACKELNLAGATDWRLPTVEELFALVDRSRQEPAIDITYFPTCHSDWYWASTPAAWSSSSAWCVFFSYGFADSYRRDSECFVRAVRSVSAPPAGQ